MDCLLFYVFTPMANHVIQISTLLKVLFPYRYRMLKCTEKTILEKNITIRITTEYK